MSMIEGGENGTHSHPGSGLQVVLKRVPGLTKRGLLQEDYYFQNAPLEEFGWDSTANFIDYEVVRHGQMTREEGGRALRAVSFQSLVVDYNPPWAVQAAGNHHHGYDEGVRSPNPRRVAAELDNILLAHTPFRLIVWNKGLEPRAEINWVVTFRTFSPRERAGELDSRYFDFSFTEFRTPRLRRKGATGGSRGHDLPATVVVDKEGIAREFVDDTADREDDEGEDEGPEKIHQIGGAGNPANLRQLAVHFYGESNRWREIAAYNGITNLGPEEPLTHLDRRGRPQRVLTIPEATWRIQIGVGPARVAGRG